MFLRFHYFAGGLVYGIGFVFVLVLIYLRVGFVGNECFFFKVSIHLYSTCLRLKAIQKKLKVATFLCFTYWVCVGFIHLHVWWEIVSLFGYIFFFFGFLSYSFKASLFSKYNYT